MGVRIIYDSRNSYAALYCSTTMSAFGPVFSGPDADSDALDFLRWLKVDARLLTDGALEGKYSEWLTEREKHG